MTNISFLFGSGISLKSGYPKMKKITDNILSGENIGRHSDLNYYFDFQQDSLKFDVDNNVAFVNYVKNAIDAYYIDLKIEHTATYEDIYYLISQVKDSEDLEFENPALKPFIDDLKNNFKEILSEHYTFKNLLNESLRYIHCVVWANLRITPTSTDQLQVLNDFAKNQDINNINMFSLNHDLLIEHHLQNSSIPFTDGFQKRSKKIPEWNLDFLKSDDYKLKLFKLHGSIDWFDIGDINHYRNIYKVPIDTNVDYIYKIDKTLQYSDGLPIFLIGTFNKLLNYLSFVYEELYQTSQTILNQCKYLIISGYSFNDKGININIIKWLNSDISKRMIVIHPDFESLRKYARGAYNIYFDPSQPSPFQNPKLLKIEKKFEDVTYGELLSILSE